jgi:hypothetical protein
MEPAGDQKLTREQISALVWAKPLDQLAKELGVTTAHLKETCKWLNIPRPPKGHWARIASQREAEAGELPAGPDGKEGGD